LAQAQPSELPESTTESPAQIALLVERVKAAPTWAEVEAVWGADLQLKAQIKAQLPEAEFKRVGKLYKQVETAQKAIALVSEQPPVPIRVDACVTTGHLSFRTRTCSFHCIRLLV